MVLWRLWTLVQVWKESTQSPTYRALRSVLDKYSVFNGRNILVSGRHFVGFLLVLLALQYCCKLLFHIRLW